MSQMPETPQYGDTITFDLETCDPAINSGSCSNVAAGGYVFLAGIKVNAGTSYCLPWDEDTREWLRQAFRTGCRWIGANLKYDLRWLLQTGVLQPQYTKTNQFSDVLLYAALLDETQMPQFYSLDKQAKHYGMQGKPVEALLEAAKAAGIKATEKTVRGQLHLLPADIVKDYLRYDLETTYAVYQQQLPLLAEERLEKVKDLEDRLIPVLAMMEHRGTKVDLKAAELLYEQVYKHIDERKERLKQANGGTEVCLNASKNLTNFLLERGHQLPKTAKGNDSTAEGVLKELSTIDPLVGDILVARKAEKIAKDFCKGAIIESNIGGRIHPNINQLISFNEGADKGAGTKSGRLSYGRPNLQQVPKRDKLEFDETGGLGTAMRRIFIAEEGHKYMSADFSAQEPRWIVHWAETWGIPGAKKVGDAYRNNPAVSSHDIVAEKISAEMPYKQKRDVAKIINLGKGYEMGPAKLAQELIKAGIDPKQAPLLIQMYEEEFPHVSGASRSAMAFAEKAGYVRTWSGRKLRFNLWEPVDRSGPALQYNVAQAKYVYGSPRVPIRRSGTYRGFNRVVQGSSADQTKLSMVTLWYDFNILPTLQVHDELDDAAGTGDKVKIYKEVMEHCIELTVPNLTEIKLGPNWADGEIYEARTCTV